MVSALAACETRFTSRSTVGTLKLWQMLSRPSVQVPVGGSSFYGTGVFVATSASEVPEQLISQPNTENPIVQVLGAWWPFKPRESFVLTEVALSLSGFDPSHERPVLYLRP